MLRRVTAARGRRRGRRRGGAPRPSSRWAPRRRSREGRGRPARGPRWPAGRRRTASRPVPSCTQRRAARSARGRPRPRRQERDALPAEPARPVVHELDVGAADGAPRRVYSDGADGEVRGRHDGRARSVERCGESGGIVRRCRDDEGDGPGVDLHLGALGDGRVGVHEAPRAASRLGKEREVGGVERARVYCGDGHLSAHGAQRDGADEGGDCRREGADLEARRGHPAAVAEAHGGAGGLPRKRRVREARRGGGVGAERVRVGHRGE